MRLAQCPLPIDMYFVEPHVKRGDYYLVMNPTTGRRMWVYPRTMGEQQPPFYPNPKFPIVSALGDDGDTPGSGLLSMLDPRRFAQEVTDLRQDVSQARTYMKLAIGASIITSAVALMAILRRRD
jgi:hypothetical protein